MKKSLKKTVQKKKVVAPKKLPKPAPRKPRAKKEALGADPLAGMDQAPEVVERSAARVVVQEISNYPGREIISAYANRGEPKLSIQAQLAILTKCDPKHPHYDKLFAEITMRQATPEPAKKEFKSFQVPLEDGYDPAKLTDPSVEGEFHLLADSPGFSLYQHPTNKKLRIVNAKTRACHEWMLESGEPIKPLDAQAWEKVVLA